MSKTGNKLQEFFGNFQNLIQLINLGVIYENF